MLIMSLVSNYLLTYRLLEDTYTVEEIEDILNDINQMIETEAESELMAASHTNVLLLQQIFIQAQKWHLDLGKQE